MELTFCKMLIDFSSFLFQTLITAAMSNKANTKVLQVTNVSPQATKEQMRSFFGSIGRVEDIKLFPEEFVYFFLCSFVFVYLCM